LKWSDEFNGSNADLEKEWISQNAPSPHILCSSDFKVQYHNGTDWTDIMVLDPSHAAYNFARDFHTYGLEWTERELIFYFDGKELRRSKNEFCLSPAPVWLSLAIIPWAGRITDAIDGTRMEVDYVRIYQRK
jgi:beta-glucanase (GH16 family)